MAVTLAEIEKELIEQWVNFAFTPDYYEENQDLNVAPESVDEDEDAGDSFMEDDE